MKPIATAWLFVAAMLICGTPLHGAGPDDSDGRVLRVERWLKAVLHHVPGASDAALAEIDAWSARELDLFSVDAGTLVRLMRDPRLSVFERESKEADCADCLGRRDPSQPRIIQPRKRIPYTDAQLHRLKVLSCAAGGMVTDPECVRVHADREIDPDLASLADRAEQSRRRGDGNFVVKRGALLHADLGMVSAGSLRPMDAARADGSEPLRIHMVDGQQTAIGVGDLHWEIGRALLDRVRPEHDAMVNLWYRATATWMQRDGHYNPVHLEHARDMFPSDADLALLSGTQSEAYASPAMQAAARSAVLPTGIVVEIRGEGAELRAAETFLRRAVQLNPGLVEARVRLGHVLLARGRAQEATNELHAAVAADSEPLLQYYGRMFLGAADEALGHFTEARESYAGASTVFPRAQSPHLALSALATRLGDRTGALTAIARVFDLPRAPEKSDEPWWSYHEAQGRKADALLAQLYAPFDEAAR